jgi:ribose-phosphate pyrophosphokinase
MTLAATAANVRVFNNKELYVSLQGTYRDVVLVTSTVTNDDWIELFLLLDALKDARSVILCMPYMGYSRQDRQNQNESFAAALFPRLLESMNVAKCIILDNHSEPMMRIPTYHISARSIFETDIIRKYSGKQMVIVSPDIGGTYRADEYAKSIGCDFAICNKAKNVFGELKKVDQFGDVSNKMCILIDDIIDSGATLCYAAEALHKSGCNGIIAYCSHGIFSDGALEKLEKSHILEIVLTNSVVSASVSSTKLRKLSIASLIAETIRCII